MYMTGPYTYQALGASQKFFFMQFKIKKNVDNLLGSSKWHTRIAKDGIRGASSSLSLTPLPSFHVLSVSYDAPLILSPFCLSYSFSTQQIQEWHQKIFFITVSSFISKICHNLSSLNICLDTWW